MPLARRSCETINIDRSCFSFTDLVKTRLGGVQNKYFRLFEPVKLERVRLPTALPEFWSLRHRANRRQDWRRILEGVELAVDEGCNLYPAIGGADNGLA